MNNPIAEKLLALRNARGLTQQQVSEELGIARATLGGYETGRRSPRLPDLQNLAEFYNVGLDFFDVTTPADVNEIIARAKDVFASDAISKDEKERLYKELMRLYLMLSE